MPITYAKGRIRYVSEDDLAVAFARDSNRLDGSVADKQYLNVADGGWDNEFDPAKHLRRLDRDAEDSPIQSFAPPNDFLVQPQGFAELYVVDSNGEPVSTYAAMDSNEAYSRTRRFSSKP